MKDQEETPEELLVEHNLEFVKDKGGIIKPLFETNGELIKFIGSKPTKFKVRLVTQEELEKELETDKTK